MMHASLQTTLGQETIGELEEGWNFNIFSINFLQAHVYLQTTLGQETNWKWEEIWKLNEAAGASEMLLAIFAGTCCHYLERLVIFTLLSVKILYLASELQIGNPSRFTVDICKIPNTLLILLFVSNSLIFFSVPFLFLYCFLCHSLILHPFTWL